MNGASRWLEARAPPPAGAMAPRATARATSLLSVALMTVSFRSVSGTRSPSRGRGREEAAGSRSASGVARLRRAEPIAGGAGPSEGPALEAGEDGERGPRL